MIHYTDVVTITESLISIFQLIVLMTATNSATQWNFTWNVSSTNDGQVLADVSGKDLAGNEYNGNESISFIIDNTNPTVNLSSSDTDNIIKNGDEIILNAIFSESLITTPTLSIHLQIQLLYRGFCQWIGNACIK